MLPFLIGAVVTGLVGVVSNAIGGAIGNANAQRSKEEAGKAFKEFGSSGSDSAIADALGMSSKEYHEGLDAINKKTFNEIQQGIAMYQNGGLPQFGIFGVNHLNRIQ